MSCLCSEKDEKSKGTGWPQRVGTSVQLWTLTDHPPCPGAGEGERPDPGRKYWWGEDDVPPKSHPETLLCAMLRVEWGASHALSYLVPRITVQSRTLHMESHMLVEFPSSNTCSDFSRNSGEHRLGLCPLGSDDDPPLQVLQRQRPPPLPGDQEQASRAGGISNSAWAACWAKGQRARATRSSGIGACDWQTSGCSCGR